MGIHVLYKPIGKTPLEMLNNINAKKKSYAGRLDPMAHGLLLVLTNEHCLAQNSFHNFDKVYIFEIIIGLTTDTHDILGMLCPSSLNNNQLTKNHNTIRQILRNLIGSIYQKYPVYSSVRVNGNPMWYWAKNNALDFIKIPGKKVQIYDLNLLKMDEINGPNLKNIILEKLTLLGDRQNKFREQNVLYQWNQYTYKDNYKRFKIRAHVSCGTYIRELTREICSRLETTGLCLDIYRECVGEYKLS